MFVSLQPAGKRPKATKPVDAPREAEVVPFEYAGPVREAA
jgi:hypothetical protein